MFGEPALTEGAHRPVVTIVMPSFNAARTIRRAIDSVVAQSYGDWRLICVDDASTDGSFEVVCSYASRLGNRLKVRRLPTNGGPARARNHGLAEANGTWIAVLDADDAWHPRRLEDLLRLAMRENADAVCDNLVGFDDHREQQTSPLFVALPGTLDVGTLVAPEYQGRYNLGYLKPMVRRSFLKAHGIRYDEALRTGEDLLFLLSCLACGGRVLCHDALGYIYTTPVGHGSGKLSRSTTTAPRDADLAAGLQRFLLRRYAGLSLGDRAAIEHRIAYLAAIAPLSNFRHARLSRDWRTALHLFWASPQVRRQIWSSLRPGRRHSSGTWA